MEVISWHFSTPKSSRDFPLSEKKAKGLNNVSHTMFPPSPSITIHLSSLCSSLSSFFADTWTLIAHSCSKMFSLSVLFSWNTLSLDNYMACLIPFFTCLLMFHLITDHLIQNSIFLHFSFLYPTLFFTRALITMWQISYIYFVHNNSCIFPLTLEFKLP